MQTIENLRKNWNIDKETFKNKELGGLQDFICDVLECVEIFNLKKGNESTKIENRKKEFTRETRKKDEKGRADFVIFINKNEIVIPVEVEKYENIIIGEKQLFRYQLEWDKKYGILTDGGTWRFYNNNIYREFSIEEIFNEPEKFLIFWNDYIKPENYYLSFFESISGEDSANKYNEENISVENNRNLFFDDITHLINNFVVQLDLAGYFKEIDIKNSKKKATEIAFAYLIQFVLYKTLVDNTFENYKNEFQIRIEEIKKSIEVNVFSTVLVHISSISSFISENLYKPFSNEQENINEKLKFAIRQPKNKIEDVSLWLDIIVFIKKYNFSNIKNDIFGYVYENYLKALYDDSKKGQYFTSPEIVNLMLDEIGYTKEEIKSRFLADGEKANISIIDPSCGSGTFLYSAVDRIIDALDDYTSERAKIIEKLINANVYGLDIAEFPLYLAEMNILMRMLPLIINEKYNNPIEKKIQVFLTRDSIAEFLDAGIYAIDPMLSKNSEQENLFDSSQLALGYKSFIRDEDNLYDMKYSLRPPRIRFDFVIGNPPYISYNECCRQNLLSFELIKNKTISLNNIYGVNLHSIENFPKKYPPKPNLYSFFISLGLALSKDNAKVSLIIPQTILTETDYDVIRFHLAKYTTIEKIITFQKKKFIDRGVYKIRDISTSSMIFVITKRQSSEKHKILYKNVKLKSQRKRILQKEALDNFKNWNYFKLNEKITKFYNSYKSITEDLSIYYDHSKSIKLFKNKFYFDVGFIINKNYIKHSKKNLDDYYLINFQKKWRNKLSDFLQYYPNDVDLIELPKASQGLESLNCKYKIIWQKSYGIRKFYFSDKNILPNMSDQQFIASNNKKEILYLLSIFNNKINYLIFQKLFSLQNEKIGMFLVIKRLKQFIRIPKITNDNQYIKDEIINQTEKMLDLEDVLLKDIVDFSNVLMQKFTHIEIKNKSLMLSAGNNIVTVKIPVNKIKIIENAINEEYFEKGILTKEINLTELKNLTVVDFEKQTKIKKYIDDLIFALYFNVEIKNIGIENSVEIENICKQNEFYDLINNDAEDLENE